MKVTVDCICFQGFPCLLSPRFPRLGLAHLPPLSFTLTPESIPHDPGGCAFSHASALNLPVSIFRSCLQLRDLLAVMNTCSQICLSIWWMGFQKHLRMVSSSLHLDAYSEYIINTKGVTCREELRDYRNPLQTSRRPRQAHKSCLNLHTMMGSFS